MKAFPSALLAFLTIVLVLALPAGPADAAKPKKKETPAWDLPMRVVIVRNNVPGCEPLCPQWISAEGQITAKTPAVFRKALAKAKSMRLPIVISSTGGDVDAALAIGKMIRQRGLDVVVGWTYFADCAPYQKDCKLPKAQKGTYRGIALSHQGYCLSACSFVLASGEKRFLGEGAFVGVHQISRTITREKVRYYEKYRMVKGKKEILSRKVVSRKPMKSYVSTKIEKRLEKKILAYFKTMGVDRALLAKFDKAPPSSMYMLDPQEARGVKLITGIISTADLVAGTRCAGDPPAENCVLLKATEKMPAL
ncbi:MAG: hypothetical protein AB7F09_28780 [Parvibaculaceae bacterium]